MIIISGKSVIDILNIILYLDREQIVYFSPVPFRTCNMNQLERHNNTVSDVLRSSASITHEESQNGDHVQPDEIHHSAPVSMQEAVALAPVSYAISTVNSYFATQSMLIQSCTFG